MEKKAIGLAVAATAALATGPVVADAQIVTQIEAGPESLCKSKPGTMGTMSPIDVGSFAAPSAKYIIGMTENVCSAQA